MKRCPVCPLCDNRIPRDLLACADVECRRRRMKQEAEPEEPPFEDCEWLNTQHGTGGGTRVIRSTRGIHG